MDSCQYSYGQSNFAMKQITSWHPMIDQADILRLGHGHQHWWGIMDFFLLFLPIGKFRGFQHHILYSFTNWLKPSSLQRFDDDAAPDLWLEDRTNVDKSREGVCRILDGFQWRPTPLMGIGQIPPRNTRALFPRRETLKHRKTHYTYLLNSHELSFPLKGLHIYR